MIESNIYAFSADNKPAAACKPGDTLEFKTMDCFTNQIKSERDLVTDLDFSRVNPAAGPVFIEGAEAGDILVVDILDITVAPQGVVATVPGSGPLIDTVENRTKVIKVDGGKAKFNNLEFDAEPMIGVIGTAPSVGSVPCGHPGRHGGNMDCKLIGKGARMFFPVNAPGALLAMGDLHARMGDGELCCTGIEIPGAVTVKVDLIKDTVLEWPVLETADKWYTIACSFDYPEALKFASLEMQRLIRNAYGWDNTDCYLYLSLQGDVEICQGCMPCDVETVLRLGVPKTVGLPLIKY